VPGETGEGETGELGTPKPDADRVPYAQAMVVSRSKSNGSDILFWFARRFTYYLSNGIANRFAPT
jgi:hypothetical protein